MPTSRIAICAVILAATSAVSASAQSAGDWTLGFGLGYSMPKYDNGDISAEKLDGNYSTRNLTVTASDSLRPTLTAEYFFLNNVGAEVSVALPYTNQLEIQDFGQDAAEISILPATLSVQYHLRLDSPFAYIFGLGVNYTWATGSDGTGELEDIEFEDSWGIAAHFGIDYWLNDRSAIRGDLRWLDIDNEATIDGQRVGEVMVDPAILGVSYIRKF